MTASDLAAGQLIVGTAGHIDHGKTALVRALTGVDTDRLPEEQARGITIDLGFAPLDLPSGRRLGVVDVPGHEGLVRTMVSGATGIDLVLLVVAADEGVMPQTREHLAICNLLDVRSGVVALTRCDLVDEEMQALAAAEIEDLIADARIAGAPIVPVSAMTGAGLDTLRDTLEAVAAKATPRTPRGGPARLWIDRAFSLRGFGSVVTGTLVGDALSLGDEVEIAPGGHRSRIRGLQSHGRDADRVEPGARCAINLQTLGRDVLARGQILSRPGALPATETADARIDWLPTAPEQADVTAVELLCGTCERRARVAPIGGTPLRPGEASFVRIHVDGPPISVLPGERFIVRGFARHAETGHTLGGGVWLDVAPPRRRRSDPDLVADLDRLARAHGPGRTGSAGASGAFDPVEEAVAVRIARSGLTGVSVPALVHETGFSADRVDRAIARLSAADEARRCGGSLVVGVAALERLKQHLTRALEAHHAAQPLRPGMSRAALRAVLPENVARGAAELALDELEAEGRSERIGDLVCIAGHRPRLGDEARALVDRIARDIQEAGLEPPGPRDHAERLGVALDAYRDLVAHLEREARLVRAPGDLWFDAETIDALREKLVAHLEARGSIDTQTYKSLIGTTRRTAMPLMELFDELQVTRRQGDVRVLRGGGSR